MRRWMLWALLATASCVRSATGAEMSPVQVADLKAEFSPGDDGLFTLTLKVQNTHDQPARVGALTMDIWINNLWFASAASEAPPGSELAARETRDIVFSLPVSFRRERSKPESVFLTFGLKGNLKLHHGRRDTTLPFKDRKRLEVKNAPVIRSDEER